MGDVITKVMLATSGNKIAGFEFPPDVAQGIRKMMVEQVTKLLAEQGPSVLETTRRCAAAHESGHVIVARYYGLLARSSEIFRRVAYGIAAHGGWTKWLTPLPPLNVATDPPAAVVAHISILISGCIAELVYDPANYRDASSLDETTVAQVLVADLAERLGMPGEELWNFCWQRVGNILKQNERSGRALMQKLLDGHGFVGAKQLNKLTAAVRRLDGDPFPFDLIESGWRSG